jgi:GNAT superfamily N-acetyltransferase
MSEWRLAPYDPAVAYKGIKEFDCGNAMINRFVRHSLKKRVRKNLSRAYLLLDNRERFAGFYTLDAFSIARESFDTHRRPSGLPPVIPVIKLGMLGIDKRYQREGLGRRLLRDAMIKTYRLSQIAGCAGLYLLAEKEAIPFYEQLGFFPLKEAKPLPMFLPLSVIAEAMKAS